MYILVDLDGTLIPREYNSTTKLLRDYFRKKRLYHRILLMYILMIMEDLFRRWIDYVKMDKYVWSIITFGLDYNDLENFTMEWFKNVPVNVDLLSDIRKYKKFPKILLTATIQPASIVFCKMFGFDNCIYTSFKISKNGKILGVTKRHLHDTKFEEVIKNRWFPYIYYTDSPREKKLMEKSFKYKLLVFEPEQKEE